MRITGRKNLEFTRQKTLDHIDSTRNLTRVHARKLWEAYDFIQKGLQDYHYFLTAEAKALGKDESDIAASIFQQEEAWAKTAAQAEADAIIRKARIRESRNEMEMVSLADSGFSLRNDQVVHNPDVMP